MKNAIIYARVSSVKQATYWDSLDSQLDIITEKCTNFWWNVLDSFSEQISGTVIDRPVLDDIYTAIRTYHKIGIKVDYLVVHKIDRFSRWWPLTYSTIKKRLEELWVELRDVYGTIQESTIVGSLSKYKWPVYDWAKINPGEIAEQVMAISSEQERKQILQRTIPKELELAYDGYWVKPPRYGFMNKAVSVWKTIQIPNPEEAKYIQKMYEMRAEYIPDIQIVEEINQMWFLTREYNKWNKNKMEVIGKGWGEKLNVKRLQAYISNPIYAWVAIVDWKCHEPKLVIQKYPWIVSIDLWNRANRWSKKLVIEWETAKILQWGELNDVPKKKRRNRYNPDFPFWKLVLVEWTTDELYYANITTGSNLTRYNYYTGDGLTGKENIKKEVFEETIIEYLKSVQADKEWWWNLLSFVLDIIYNVREDELSENQKVLSEELSKLKLEKDSISSKIHMAFDLPEILHEINNKLTEVKWKISDLEEKLVNEKRRIDIDELKKYSRSFIENLWTLASNTKDREFISLIFQFVFYTTPTYKWIVNRNTPLNFMLALNTKKRIIDDSLDCVNWEILQWWQSHLDSNQGQRLWRPLHWPLCYGTIEEGETPQL